MEDLSRNMIGEKGQHENMRRGEHTLGGGGGGHGGTACLLTNFSVKADVAEAKGLPLRARTLFLFLGNWGSSKSSNSMFGFQSSVVALLDKDVII